MGTLHARTRRIDDPARLTDFLPPTGGLLWTRGDEGLVGWGEAIRISPGTGPDRFVRAETEWRALVGSTVVDDEAGVPGSGPVAFGSFTFDDGSTGSGLVVPDVVVGHRDGVAFTTRFSTEPSNDDAPLPQPTTGPELEPGAADRPRYAGASLPDVLWLEAVASAVEAIAAGELDKVVLARDHAVWSRTPFDPRLVVHRLERRFPSCFTFVVDDLVGATPELLVRRIGDAVTSLALAGTAPRGDDDTSDRAAAGALLASEKDRWEHELAARTVREVLARRCRRLEADAEPRVLRLDNVMHLATRFEGELAEDLTSLGLAADLHPTAAVGGVPSHRAVETIRALEGMDRGRYAGPVGWMDGNGDGEWGIALRCAELSGARARLFAGAGIVAGSLPEDELEETRVKLQAMLSVLDAEVR